MYYIEQAHGELANAGHRLHRAVKNCTMETAKRIYRQYVGEPPTDSLLWWIYNAPSRIRQASGLTADDWAAFNGTQEQRCKQAARLAEQRVGGTWVVCYEY
jgi:hypothetical protein